MSYAADAYEKVALLLTEQKARFAEATALLKRVHGWAVQPYGTGAGPGMWADIAAFLSRAPAQPASAGFPEQFAQGMGELLKPAALTDYDVSDGYKYAQPAAPEPSAVHERTEAYALGMAVSAQVNAELRASLNAAESQLAAVRSVVASLGNSFERTSMYMEEEQRTGKATALSITRMSARKAALEQVLEELRAALSPPSPSAVPGETQCTATAWSGIGLRCTRPSGHTGNHVASAVPGEKKP